MLIIIDRNELKQEIETLRDELEIIHIIIKENCNKVENFKLIISARLSDFMESWDSGPGPDFYRSIGWKPPPRCDLGYYSSFNGKNFWVSSSIKDNAVLICHDKGVNAIEFNNFKVLNFHESIPNTNS